MKYIILAAGKGTRLHPVTHTIPKPLVRLINKKTILENEICTVRQTGFFDEIIIVTGYREKQILETVKNIKCPIKITCIHNYQWEHTSPLFSLLAAKEIIQNYDVVITNGDTIHLKNFFNVFRLKHPVNDIRLFVSIADKYQEDDMRVKFSKKFDRLMKISKQLSYDETHGVSAGMLLLKGNMQRLIFINHLTTLLSSKTIKPYWHSIIDQLIHEKEDVNFSIVPYDSWFEVDTIADLIEASKYYK